MMLLARQALKAWGKCAIIIKKLKEGSALKHIRKYLSVILAGALLLSLLSFWASAAVGDVNADGDVNMKDVLVLRKHIANIAPCTDEVAADINSDGSLDMKDVLRLRLFIVNGFGTETSEAEVNAVVIETIELINQRRAEAGLAPMQYNAKLQKAAEIRVKELKESFSYTRPNGTSWTTVLDECGVVHYAVGACIASGHSTPESLITSLMGSEGNRNNLLSTKYTDVAVGFDPETKNWALLFIKSSDELNLSASEVKAMEQKVVEIVNQRRAEVGLSPMKYNAALQPIADLRVKELETLFDHTRPNGSSCFTAFDELGVTYHNAGENIAYGYKTAEDVMAAWMASTGHRANILNADYTEIAVALDPKTKNWVQVFRRP